MIAELDEKQMNITPKKMKNLSFGAQLPMLPPSASYPACCSIGGGGYGRGNVLLGPRLSKVPWTVSAVLALLCIECC